VGAGQDRDLGDRQQLEDRDALEARNTGSAVQE
jgi:hypothetical protein